MNRIIRTVRGDIPETQLGFCDCHCHPLVISDHLLEYNRSYFDVGDVEIAKKELMKFKSAGGVSAVDCQPIGAGRASVEITRLSEETGLNIIACTGFHMQAFYPPDHWTFTFSERQLTDIYVSEITEGMYTGTENSLPDTRINAKAGFIKNATEQPDFDDTDKHRLRAAANASKLTGAPLLCHTRRSALTHIPFLLDCGVPPESIIVAHLDKSGLPFEEYHLKVAEMGVFLEFDNIVNARVNTKEYEIDLIKNVIDAGFKDKLILGSDPVRPSYKSYDPGGHGLDYIAVTFLDMLRDAGVTQNDIITITERTPGKAFSFIPKA